MLDRVRQWSLWPQSQIYLRFLGGILAFRRWSFDEKKQVVCILAGCLQKLVPFHFLNYLCLPFSSYYQLNVFSLLLFCQCSSCLILFLFVALVQFIFCFSVILRDLKEDFPCYYLPLDGQLRLRSWGFSKLTNTFRRSFLLAYRPSVLCIRG